jgi:hypothetical protein
MAIAARGVGAPQHPGTGKTVCRLSVVISAGKFGEPLPRIGLSSRLGPVLGDSGSLFVDRDHVGLSEHCLRIAVESLDATFDQRARADVVVCGQTDVITASELDGEILVVDAADVDTVPVLPGPIVSHGKGTTDVGGTVRRRVVGDHEFDVAEDLVENRLDRLGHEVGAVVDRHPDGHPRIAGVATASSRAPTHVSTVFMAVHGRYRWTEHRTCPAPGQPRRRSHQRRPCVRRR